MPIDMITQAVSSVQRVTTSTPAGQRALGKPPESRQELPPVDQALPDTSPARRNDQKLEQAVSELSTYVQSLKRELQFSVDGESGSTVVRVVDPATGETIRQIPSDEVLAVARALSQESAQQGQGILLNTKV